MSSLGKTTAVVPIVCLGGFFGAYTQLGLGGLKKIDITICLADRSVKYPKGVVKDVIVKVKEFYFPVDFVVLAIEPVIAPNRHIPIILGRPFLTTSNVVIRCRNGIVTLSLVNMKLELNVFRNELQTSDLDDDEEVNMIDTSVDQTFQSSCLTKHFNHHVSQIRWRNVWLTLMPT